MIIIVNLCLSYFIPIENGSNHSGKHRKGGTDSLSVTILDFRQRGHGENSYLGFPNLSPRFGTLPHAKGALEHDGSGRPKLHRLRAFQRFSRNNPQQEKRTEYRGLTDGSFRRTRGRIRITFRRIKNLHHLSNRRQEISH